MQKADRVEGRPLWFPVTHGCDAIHLQYQFTNAFHGNYDAILRNIAILFTFSSAIMIYSFIDLSLRKHAMNQTESSGSFKNSFFLSLSTMSHSVLEIIFTNVHAFMYHCAASMSMYH